MSRDSRDIPIRPRYGIEQSDIDNEEKLKSRRLSSNMNAPQQDSSIKVVPEEMASSYSEIPFLAHLTSETQGSESNANNPEDSVYYENDDLLDSSDDEYDENKVKNTPQRPKSLQYDSPFPHELESSASNGKMRHFVAKNLEEKLRSAPLKQDQLAYSSNNTTSSASTASSLLTRHYLQTQVPQIDANALSDIELEAQYLAASVDNLMENLCNLLHSISSITADNVEVHKSAVSKLTDSMDANIKCMYTIMAKTEEITKTMKPTEQLSQRIREIKRLVDMLDAAM